MSSDSSDLVIAMQLLDQAKLRGFQFRRVAPGDDGPLMGHRVRDGWLDLIYIEGFSRDCIAWRQRASPLIIPGHGRVEHQVDGRALDVLREVLTWQMPSDGAVVDQR